MSAIFPNLLTSRLHLREIEVADAPALFTIHADAEWMRWYGVEPLTDFAEAQRLAEMFHNWTTAGTGYRWGMERRSDGRLIGTCGLFRWNHSWRNCVIGYEIARDCQRLGYTHEALHAILDFGFDTMNLHRVQAETHPENLASIGIAKKLGFRFEGVHREQAFWGGQFHDLHCYSLLEFEWRTISTPGLSGPSAACLRPTSMHERPLLNIVGAGKLGRTLGRLWQLHQVFDIQDVLNRSAASANDAVAFIGAGRSCSALQELRPAAVWLIGVGDESVGECCDTLTGAGKLEAGNVVFHCSGALPSTVLRTAADARAAIASVHPIRSFAVPEQAVAEFSGTWCGLEGDAQALALLEPAFRSIGGLAMHIATDKKTLYHAAAVFASNYLVTLVDVALRAYAEAGIAPDSARELIKPLMRGTLENVLHVGPEQGLSGPIARGDFRTVARQQQAVTEWDADCGELYEKFIGLTAKIAARKQPH